MYIDKNYLSALLQGKDFIDNRKKITLKENKNTYKYEVIELDTNKILKTFDNFLDGVEFINTITDEYTWIVVPK